MRAAVRALSFFRSSAVNAGPYFTSEQIQIVDIEEHHSMTKLELVPDKMLINLKLKNM